MLKRFYSICIPLLLAAPFAMADISTQRQQFLAAEKALASGKTAEYRRLRSQLEDYPLRVYLDFSSGIDQLIRQDATKALAAMTPFKDSPLWDAARHRYLMSAGDSARWQDFLSVSPTIPRDTVLQCYFYRAQLKQGDSKLAFKGARRLWLNGSSQPKQCDPLFDAWSKAGQRTQARIWSRMFLAFEARQERLLGYLAKQVTDRPKDAQKLLSLYRDPAKLKHQKDYTGKPPEIAKMVEVALKAMARKNLSEAITLLGSYEKAGRFSKVQAAGLHSYMVRRVLLLQDPSQLSYADARLAALKSDDLTELRLRWAIRDADFESIRRFLPLLSEESQSKDRWQYWAARLSSESATTSNIKTALAGERSFYGFYIADELGKAAAMVDKPAAKTFESTELAKDEGFARVTELLQLDRLIQARREWLSLLARHPAALQAAYGRWAETEGHYALAVDASIQGKFWDDLAMRFPPAEAKNFRSAAAKHKLNVEEIRAIARRESAFYPLALSPVGARGLMQVMPATARHTAKKLRTKYQGDKALFEPAYNIGLGAAYYASLLARYKQNRVLATAAYNAGPARVDSWLSRSKGTLDVMSFIEAIPFSETREYVQSVFSYRLIYEYRNGTPKPLFSKQERDFAY